MFGQYRLTQFQPGELGADDVGKPKEALPTRSIR